MATASSSARSLVRHRQMPLPLCDGRAWTAGPSSRSRGVRAEEEEERGFLLHPRRSFSSSSRPFQRKLLPSSSSPAAPPRSPVPRKGRNARTFPRTGGHNNVGGGTKPHALQSSSSSSSSPPRRPPSMAASMMEDWERPPFSGGRPSRRLSPPSSSYSHPPSSRPADGSSSRPPRHHTRGLQAENFAEKQRLFCATVAEYRDVWYPGTAATSFPSSDSPARKNGSRNGNGGSISTVRGGSSNVPQDWKEATQFRHPPPSVVSWRQLVESEGTFRTLCSLHHELFVTAASLVDEDYGGGGGGSRAVVMPTPNQYADWMDEDGAAGGEEGGTPLATRSVDNVSSSSSEEEDILYAIVPFWEAMREERADLVDRLRPALDGPAPEEGRGADDAPDQRSGRTTQWVGWLRDVIDSFGLTAGDGPAGSAPVPHPDPPVTAHADPGFAPNQYHYTKLVSILYFHYLSQQQRKVQQQHHQPHPSPKPVPEVAPHLPHPSPAVSHERRQRQEMLQQRAALIQGVVDRCPSPDAVSYKMIRLLVRSYQDVGTLDACHQAERTYNNHHPDHQSGTLWYVLSGYLQLVLLQQQQDQEEAMAAAATIDAARRPRFQGGYEGGGSSGGGGGGGTVASSVGHDRTAALAARRICELLSTRHADDEREFQTCAMIGFQALAALPPQSLDGYYDRVHSLGILKFGPWVWAALVGTGGGSGNSHHLQGGESKPPPNDEDVSVGGVHPDLAEALHSKEHKTLHHLVQIYAQDEAYISRALALVDTSFDLFSTETLQESFWRSTFHGLLGALTRQRKGQRRTERLAGRESANPQLDAGLRLLDKMILQRAWFPNHETFVHLFHLVDGGPDAERVRVALELCQFLSDDKTYPFSPLKAAKYSLNAWTRTAAEGARGAEPVVQAWEIFRGLQALSTPLLLSEGRAGTVYHPEYAPDESVYTLLIKVCGRRYSKKAWDVTLRVFEIVKREGILTRGSICAGLLRSISNSPDLPRRAELMREVYTAALAENVPMKPAVMAIMRKQLSYFRKQHPELFEAHFADLAVDIDRKGKGFAAKDKEFDENDEEDEIV